MSNSSEYMKDETDEGGSRRTKNKDEGTKIPPTFKSGPKVYKEELGTTALLLCKVNNLGKFFVQSNLKSLFSLPFSGSERRCALITNLILYF